MKAKDKSPNRGETPGLFTQRYGSLIQSPNGQVTSPAGNGEDFAFFAQARKSTKSPPRLRYVTLTRTNDFKQRWARATMMREQVEEADMKRKFLLLHRREINRHHVKLLLPHQIERNP